MITTRFRVAAAALATLVAAGVAVATTQTGDAAPSATAISSYVPPAKHVFVINIENKGYDKTWGPGSAAPYLSVDVRNKGVLLNDYYGTAHNSQPNYVAQISGQGPNPVMQSDCQTYADFVQTGSASPGQAVGQGCVFPAGVQSLPTQLQAKKLTWKGYMEDMATPCLHPAANAPDPTQQATAANQYAVRHNPFMYFKAITGSATLCAQHVVNLSKLTTDLAAVSTTPNLSYITPDLCSDGHDSPCADGRPGGLASVDAFMKVWVPRILNSPAFMQDGVLIITADEADSPQSDATACCGETAVNTPQAGISGPGGGRIGALVISKWTTPGTWSTTPYNHYALLASIEDIFGLPYLGYAGASGLDRFGLDVYNSGWNG